MKFLAIMLLSILIALWALCAQMSFMGSPTPTPDLSLNQASMAAHGASLIISSMDDMAPHYLHVATFLTAAIPSNLMQISKTILTLLVLFGSVALGFGILRLDIAGQWKLTALRRSFHKTVLYLAHRLFRKWHALLKLSPNFIATASG